jgi:UDP-glucose 4-epimerase
VQAELTKEQDWSSALVDVDVIVHCAARVHVMNDEVEDPLEEFRKINVEGTLSLARQAAEAGARRFIFISSIKVNGEVTELGHPFTADDVPAPQDSYGVSKMEAERGLRELSVVTGMEVVIIRPPLVYGPGVKANFASMMLFLMRGMPLPLGSLTTNCRSLVFVENLVDLIYVCISHSNAANQTFLVSDDEDISTATLLKRMAKALGCKVRLLPMHPLIIALAAKLIRRPGIVAKLCGSLQVDITKTKELLNWAPSLSIDEGFLRTAQAFLKDGLVK